MCTIAGYAGTKRAAPILIEMLRKEQFMDGGLSTGIATVHEGKLYTAKVTGDLDTLLRETNAMELPGTVGIIHSRTSKNLLSHAHPFISGDGRFALVENGTTKDTDTPELRALSDRIVREFLDRGIRVDSAFDCDDPGLRKGRSLPNGQSYHPNEPYALMIGDMVKDAPARTLAEDLVKATKKTLETLPLDTVILGVHADLDDTITVGVISRPMHVGYGDGETYLATVPIAFPDEIQKNPVLLLPPTSVSQITPGGARIVTTQMEGVRVEPISFPIAGACYSRLEAVLKGQKDTPKSLYDFGIDLSDLWSEPRVDCRYALESGLLKPCATGMYHALWNFHQEGRLHMVTGERNGNPITKFWID